jgi:hypothetical protein
MIEEEEGTTKHNERTRERKAKLHPITQWTRDRYSAFTARVWTPVRNEKNTNA